MRVRRDLHQLNADTTTRVSARFFVWELSRVASGTDWKELSLNSGTHTPTTLKLTTTVHKLPK